MEKMQHKLFILIMFVVGSQAFGADAQWRSVKTSNLHCCSQRGGCGQPNERIHLKISASPGNATQILIKEINKEERKVVIPQDLVVGSEGKTSIHLISEQEGINLLLFGNDLTAFLVRNYPKDVELTGTIQLTTGVHSDLYCTGTFK